MGTLSNMGWFTQVLLGFFVAMGAYVGWELIKRIWEWVYQILNMSLDKLKPK